MPYKTRIPNITAQISLGIQRVVHETGEAVEFDALRAAGQRRKSGDEQGSIRWVPSRSDPHYGEVIAGTFYTRFAEYGTVHQVAEPILGPVGEQHSPGYVTEMRAAVAAASR